MRSEDKRSGTNDSNEQKEFQDKNRYKHSNNIKGLLRQSFFRLNMLQKKYRLKKYSAFIATYKVNNAISDNNICIYFGKEKKSADIDTKIAFVVSKKIHKRAVVRNRIKRLMRESIRLSLKENKYPDIHKYLSIICVAKPAAIDADFKIIDNSLNTLIEKKLH